MDDLLVVGSGLTGLAVAKTLQQRNATSGVRLLDQSSKSPSYSLTLLDSTIQKLEGAWDCSGALSKAAVDAQLGQDGSIQQRYVDGQSGKAVDGPGQAGSSKRISREALDKFLKEGISIQYDKKVDKVERTDKGVKLHFRDESTTEGSFAFVCDGIHSSIRAQLYPSIKPEVLPYVVYSGQRKLSKAEAEPFLSATSTVRTAYLPNACITFAFNTISEEGGRLQWIYSRNPLPDSDPLFTPGRSNPSARDIPEALYEELHSHAEACIEPFKSLLKSIAPDNGDRQYNWLMREVDAKAVAEAQSDLDKNRVMLLGDAAHAMPIFG